MAKNTAMRWEEMNKDNASLETLALQYEVFNRAEGKTKCTVEWYRTITGIFIDYLKSRGLEPILGNIDIGIVREYILHLQGRKRYDGHPQTPKQEELLSPTSIQGYIRALKTFFNWLYKEGYTEE